MAAWGRKIEQERSSPLAALAELFVRNGAKGDKGGTQKKGGLLRAPLLPSLM
jgi:hypothetical protein